MDVVSSSFTPAADELIFVPLGGAGEIGMNLNLFCCDGKWLMVDLGVTFGDDTTPGVDIIMPDPAFITERRADLVGLVLTHAHEDHVGAVPHLWPQLRCPIYATPFTASIARRKLAEAGLAEVAEVTEIPLEGQFEVGPYTIRLITLTHSIPEPNALVIQTRHGSILHTGDWKFDPTPLVGPPPDIAALERLGEEGVLALIGDSTNVFTAGEAGSESAVRDSLIELVGRFDKRVAIACFASNVARLETVAAVAEAHGRHAALVGRSLWRMYDAARENGYLTEIKPFISENEIGFLPEDKVLMAVTGSQGEPRAALARIAAGSHPQVTLDAGDAVIFSSRIIPGNERSIGRLHNALISQGIEVVTEKDHFVHVSGHPCRDELVRMYQAVKPSIAIPVHGEIRHLIEHEKLARGCQVGQTAIAPNGSAVRLAPGRAEIIDHVPSGRLALDGNSLVPLEGEAMRERRRIGFNGAAMATIVVDADGALVAPAQVALQGVAGDSEAGDDLEAALVDAVEDTLDKLDFDDLRDDEAIAEAVRRALRRTLTAMRGKKTPTKVHVVRVP
jgi:ribonuclease J